MLLRLRSDKIAKRFTCLHVCFQFQYTIRHSNWIDHTLKLDAPVHTLSKLYDFPVGFVPNPLLRLCIALFSVAEGWLLLDIGWFVLFLYLYIVANSLALKVFRQIISVAEWLCHRYWNRKFVSLNPTVDRSVFYFVIFACFVFLATRLSQCK